MRALHFLTPIVVGAIALTTTELSAQLAPRLISFPSPNAASLGLHTSTPVSHFTGTPDISIPLYEVVEGPIKLPITLSYHPVC